MEATMRRLVLSLTLALTLSAVGASSVLAAAPEGAQKVPLYGPFNPAGLNCATGGTPTPGTFGFAVLNTPGDETTLSGEIALKHVAPNATYPVDVLQDCGSTFVGTITTNTKGNGNLEFTTERDPGTTEFIVDVNAGTLEEIVSPVVELD
jgi:hypothetical protein